MIFKTLFGSYHTTGIIGEGGTGKVYKVVDDNGEEYALKYLDPQKATSDKRKRFKNEISFCLRDTHKNIIKVHDYGIDIIKNQTYHFYIMPYYPLTLRGLLKKGISHDKSLHHFSQILDGVEAAHLQSIWHRDLKPENILFDTHSDLLIIADFGIAHFAEECLHTLVKTHPNARLANFQYAAPEQRGVGRKVDHRADIYALGLILNELFTGEIIQGSNYTTIGNVAPVYAYLDNIVDIMIRQSLEERISSIDLVKQQLIARKNEFISRQRLSELKNTVVLSTDIDDRLFNRLQEVDYKEGKLVFILNQRVTESWAREFRRIGDYNAIIGKEPSIFQFEEDRTSITIHDEGEVQKLTDYFKDYLEKANRDYRNSMLKYQKERELEQRRKLQEQIQKEEKRQRILKNIKI